MSSATWAKFTVLAMFLIVPILGHGQEILGRWQLIKQSTCVDDELDSASATEEELVADMKTMAGPAPQVLQFKENNTAVESTKIINRRKNYNSNALLYKYTGTDLHFLDKKSRTIIESYTVEKISADSLIITNAARVCETLIFVKIAPLKE